MIVNDFGEASLDEVALAEGEPFRITNIPGGCVCCTAPEGFVDALGAVLAQRPDRLLIEPTGLARPQDLIDTIRRCPHGDALELAPVVVMVDPHQLAAPGVAQRCCASRRRSRTCWSRTASISRARASWPRSIAMPRSSGRRRSPCSARSTARCRTSCSTGLPARVRAASGTHEHVTPPRALHRGSPRALVALVARRGLLGPAPARRARVARGRSGGRALQGDLPHRGRRLAGSRSRAACCTTASPRSAATAARRDRARRRARARTDRRRARGRRAARRGAPRATRIGSSSCCPTAASIASIAPS